MDADVYRMNKLLERLIVKAELESLFLCRSSCRRRRSYLICQELVVYLLPQAGNYARVVELPSFLYFIFHTWLFFLPSRSCIMVSLQLRASEPIHKAQHLKTNIQTETFCLDWNWSARLCYDNGGPPLVSPWISRGSNEWTRGLAISNNLDGLNRINKFPGNFSIWAFVFLDYLFQ